jgi:hypothetical protein
MKKKLLALLCAGMFFCAAAAALYRADRAYTAEKTGDLLYLPNEKLLTHFTAGLSSVIADMIWLRCVQYTAIENRGERNFTWLEQMLRTAVRLDPYFTDVYRYGGMFLAALRAEDDAALELLHEGMIQNPDAWELPYECAMVYMLNRRHEPDAGTKAGYYLALSAGTGNAPEYVSHVAQKLHADHDMAGIEREMWTNMLQSSDKLLRDLAERKLRELDLREACKALEARKALYEERTGRPLAELEALVRAGLIRRLPEDPSGGRFFIDARGRIQNTSLLNARVSHQKRMLDRALERHEEEQGTLPESLDALIGAGIMKAIPEHPYAGRSWQYDPETGTLK